VVAVPLKPYYNPVNLENAETRVKQKEFILRIGRAQTAAHAAYQRSGAPRGHFLLCVARMEALGLVSPQRTQSRYRLFSESDVRLLQRAIFLRRARGLNPPPSFTCSSARSCLCSHGEHAPPGSAFPPPADPPRPFAGQVARATGVSIGFLSALERGQMRSSIATLRRIARFYRTNILSLFETAGNNPRLVRPNQRKILETTPDVRMELLAWETRRWSRIFSASNPPAAAVNPTRTRRGIPARPSRTL